MSAMREALEAAFDEHAEEDDESQEPKDTKPAEKPGKNDGLGADEPIEDIEPKEPAEKPLKSEPKPSEGLKGGEQVPADRKQEKVVKQEPQAPAVKAPVSWRPEVREKFSSIPPEVQQEVLRREREVDQTLRQTAEARNYAGRLNQIVSPYEAMIRAEGGDHFTAVDSLLKTAYHLRTANPQAKAQMVAQMIMQHGVDPNLLDQALAAGLQGKQQQIQQDPMMQYVQQQLAPMQQFFQGLQQHQQTSQQRQGQDAVTEMQTFASDPKNEYFEDVRGIMADMLEISARNGQQMTLQDAYQRATLAHPTIAPLVMNRQMTATATQRSAAARKARNASASLPSGGAPAGAADTASKPKSVRSAVEAAWDAVENKET